MKALLAATVAICSLVAAGAHAGPASEPAPKPAMRSMSPMTTPNSAVARPLRADDVWVNRRSKIYHCPGNRWYGRTPSGEYMSEADALAKSYKAEKGKSCG